MAGAAIQEAGTRCPPALLAAVRAAASRGADWPHTASLVAAALAHNLPTPGVLTATERAGDPAGYTQHILHTEDSGSFSVVAVVWRPGQVTPIHDHVTWCVIGVIAGTEHEELFELAGHPGGEYLVPAGVRDNATGSVSGFAPPGDIHRVRNTSPETAISIHVYGADISRLGSSVRRCYGLPVLATRR